MMKQGKFLLRTIMITPDDYPIRCWTWILFRGRSEIVRCLNHRSGAESHYMADGLYYLNKNTSWIMRFNCPFKTWLLCGCSDSFFPRSHNLVCGRCCRPHTPLSTVRIFVTRDGEHYDVVNISGAADGSEIRHHILSKVLIFRWHQIGLLIPRLKLDISEQLSTHYSIFASEVGSLALGGALDDESLFALCQESGNPIGDLKFYVSES